MNETKFIWMDGKLVPWAEAQIHPINHSLHYGSAVFEGIRFYKTADGPAIFRLKEHVDRLFFSAKTMYMEAPFTPEEITQAIIDTVKINEVDSGYIRPLIYYGYGKMGLSIVGAPVNVLVAAWPWGAYLGDKPVRVKTSSFARISNKSFVMGAKVAGHYVNSILAGEEVKRLGYDEALLLDHKGNIAEGPGENLFVFKRGKLITPTTDNTLAGITRASILEIAKNLGIKTEEKIIKLKNIYGADEAFFTGTAAEVSSIASINDINFKQSPGPITSKLKQAFAEIIEGRDKKYEHWLTVVK